MCGFSGIFSFKKNINQNQIDVVKKMTDSIAHRGPDDSKFYDDENLSLGFRRLSIIDIKNGQQPMLSKNKNYLICFNGEIYNYKSIQRRLREKGVLLKTSSDTEVLLESFSLWGKESLKIINGMFSFVIYDKSKKKIYLARDRFGMKPLFYNNQNDQLLFSSEIKGLIASNLIEKKINENAISSYLTFRYPYGVGTFFKNIDSLEPGQILEINKDKVSSKEYYWELPINKKKEKRNEKFYSNIIEEKLEKTMLEHLESDVEIGSLLSGGLDSSLITAMMAKNIKYKIKTFSASFDHSDYDEIAYAKLVSKKYSTNHINIKLSARNYLDSLTEVINVRQTPLSIPHEVALYDLFKKIGKHVKVVMSGEGADELFGGYGRVQTSAHDYNKINFIKKYLPFFSNTKIFKLLNLDLKSDSKCDFFLNVYNWIPIKQKLELLNNEFKNKISNDEKIINFWYEEFNKISELNTHDQFLFIFQKLHLRCLLDRLDVLSMASSVEARVPFVDHNLVELVMSVPYEYKFRWKSKYHKALGLFNNSFINSEKNDISKFILRKIGSKYLDSKIAYKKKLGFPVPLDEWSKSIYFESAKEILLDSKTRSRGIFNCNNIEKLLMKKENLNYDFWGKKIWMLMNVEVWHREVVDS